MNLHQIVRGPICSVNADEDLYLIQALGQVNNKGLITAEYAAAERIKGQVQTLSPDEMQAVDTVLRTAHLRKFYLFAATYAGHMPQGQKRIFGQPNDYIYRPYDGTYWLIYQVSEDFSPAGWVCVGASLQIEVPPAVIASLPASLKP